MFALVLHRCRHPHTVFRDSQWFHFDIYRNVFPSCCYWSIAAVTVSLGLSSVIKTNCNYFIVIKATVRLGTARQKYTGWHFNCSVAHITILLLVPLWNILKLLQCVYFFFIIILLCAYRVSAWYHMGQQQRQHPVSWFSLWTQCSLRQSYAVVKNSSIHLKSDLLPMHPLSMRGKGK